jgi:acyl-CoA hydrolase
MKLVIKGFIPGDSTNGNGSTKGGWLFEQLDLAALTYISELFLCEMPGILAVTNSADVKFISPAFAYGYIEIWADIETVSPGSIGISVYLNYRDKKSKEFKSCVSGTVSFSLINKDRKIVRIPRKIINEIKG